MKYLNLITLLLLWSCNDRPTIRPISKTEAIYPLSIVQSGLESKYDKTKWYLYCIYCDDTCKFTRETGIKKTAPFSSMELKFDTVTQYNDTIEISFNFYYQDSIKCDASTIRNSVASGAGFKKGSDSIYYFTSTSTMQRFWTNDPYSRFVNPLQPDMIRYLKAKKLQLHPWFYAEAQKRGIVD